MSANSKIEWTDHTFNPWIGCTKVSPACDHCYAEVSTPSRTLGVTWGAGQERRRTSAANWAMPLRWNAQAEVFRAQHGRRQRVFCASLADVFDNAVPDEWRVDLFRLIAATPKLDWLLLTKRIGNAFEMIKLATAAERAADPGVDVMANVWLGATICNQEEADRDIPKLLAVPARVRFLSIEPLLGQLDLTKVHEWRGTGINPWGCLEGYCGAHYPKKHCGCHCQDAAIDWVIVGGESRHQARPMHPDWVRSLRDQCAAAGVPFLFKQWGEWLPISQQDEAFNRSLYRSNRKAQVHEDQSAIDECYGRTCTVASTVVHADGSTHDILEPMAFLQGTDAVSTFKAGKKAAGRLLDGVQHDGYPA